jgi:hypothetical protein
MTEEPEDVKQLRSKLKAIELERKRKIASNILNVLYKRLYYTNKPFEHRQLIDVMIEFEQTMKKIGI